MFLLEVSLEPRPVAGRARDSRRATLRFDKDQCRCFDICRCDVDRFLQNPAANFALD
jgi:hypothetical protein